MSFWPTPVKGAAEPFLRTLLYRTTDLAGTVSGWVTVEWDEGTEDPLGAHDPSVNPERITIPAGIRFARLTAFGNFNNSGSVRRLVIIDKDGAQVAADLRWIVNEGSLSVASAWIPVAEGDYFVVQFSVDSAFVSLEGNGGFGGRSFFQAEFVR